MRIYGTYSGFKQYIQPRAFPGAYVSMEHYARGLLKHGHFDEYHAYFDEQYLSQLTPSELLTAYHKNPKLKTLDIGEIITNRNVPYHVIHSEAPRPHEEVVFRGMLSAKNVPLTRRTYTIATVAHLRELLDICLLENGARPYDSIVLPSTSTRETVLSYFAEVESVTGGRHRYRGRIDVIPYGIPVDDLGDEDKGLSRQVLGLPQDRVIILCVARLSATSKMNLSRLLNLFQRVRTQTTAKLHLVLAGGAQEHDCQTVCKAIEDLGMAGDVTVVANFDNRIKKKLYGSADIFVSLCDNLQESFGLALVEAMASGLPLVCTDWDGYKDIVDNEVNGWLIPTTWNPSMDARDVLACLRYPYDHTVLHRLSQEVRIDEELLAAKTLALVHSEELRRTMGRNGRAKARSHFSTPVEISRFEELWDELARMASCDTNTYYNLCPVLSFNYGKHFASYASRPHSEI